MITVNKNSTPFFSVITCTYNRAGLLPRALDSLLNQTEKDWEALIVDDGSSDETTEIVKHYINIEPKKIRYLYHANKGLSLSRNVGLLAASGLFLTFLDSDDEYLSSHLAFRKKALFQNPEVDLLHGGVEIIGDPFVPDIENPGKKIHLNDCIIGGTFFIRKELAIALNGFKVMDIGDDYDFYNRALKHGALIGKVDEPTYIYHRDSPDSICNNQ